MGIDVGMLDLILEESVRKPFTGEILTLGKMDVYFSAATLKSRSTAMGIELRESNNNKLAYKKSFSDHGYISDKYLFKRLGFNKVHSLDVSDYEGADVFFDLNSKEMPDEFIERFDVILESGTSEHIFHLPNLLNNLFKMLRVGGRAIHISPASNYMEHGYYMFSPRLFWDYYTANRYDINTALILRQEVKSDTINTVPYIKYIPGLIEQKLNKTDGRAYFIFFIATKIKDATGSAIPIQNPNMISEIMIHDITHREGVYYDAVYCLMRNVFSDGVRKVAFYGIGGFAEIAMIAANEAGWTLRRYSIACKTSMVKLLTDV